MEYIQREQDIQIFGDSVRKKIQVAWPLDAKRKLREIWKLRTIKELCQEIPGDLRIHEVLILKEKLPVSCTDLKEEILLYNL